MNIVKRNPVLGAICGDMIGVPYESYCRRDLPIDIDFKLWTKDSTFSDDTVMTLAVAKWLLDRPLNTNNLIKIMQDLGSKYPNVGYGSMFKKWFRNSKPYNSYGNGSAMRVSPVGCAFSSEDTVLLVAEESASVSHNHPEGVKGAKVVADLIWMGLRQMPKLDPRDGAFNKDLIANQINTNIAPDYNLCKSPEEIKESGYRFDSTCKGSVPEAICCFLRSNSYEQTIRNAVWLRGDTDTQAAIAGSIAAAYWGVPVDIIDECLNRLPFDLLNILEEFSANYELEL